MDTDRSSVCAPVSVPPPYGLRIRASSSAPGRHRQASASPRRRADEFGVRPTYLCVFSAIDIPLSFPRKSCGLQVCACVATAVVPAFPWGKATVNGPAATASVRVYHSLSHQRNSLYFPSRGGGKRSVFCYRHPRRPVVYCAAVRRNRHRGVCPFGPPRARGSRPSCVVYQRRRGRTWR